MPVVSKPSLNISVTEELVVLILGCMATSAAVSGIYEFFMIADAPQMKINSAAELDFCSYHNADGL